MGTLKNKTTKTGEQEEKVDAGSNSDSASSGRSVGSSARSFARGDEVAALGESAKFFLKRPRPETDKGSSSDGELASARKIATSRRGKAPVVGGRGGGSGRTAVEVAQRARRLAEEGRHPDAVSRKSDLSGLSDSEPDTAGGSAHAEQKARFAEAVDAAFKDVAQKRLKASKSRATRAAIASIMAAAEASFGPPKGEMADLRAEIARLTAATELLQKENEELRANLARLEGTGSQEEPKGGHKEAPRQAAPEEDQVLLLVRKELAAFNARFSVLEGIVLRPPLASATAAKQGPPDKGGRRAMTDESATPAPAKAAPAKTASAKPAPVNAAPAKPTTAKPAPANPAAQKKGKATQVAKAPGPAKQRQPVSSAPTPPSKPPAADAEWQVAGEKEEAAKAKRKARRKEKRAEKRRAQRRRRKGRGAADRLRAPKTAAVVLTLQPEAEKRGVSYRDVLAKAKEAVDLRELGITGGLRLRVTQTGARMLEIPGAASGPTADALAEKLRASLNADEARVSRPTKCVDLRILGLDDSVTEVEVVAAVARTGGCPADQVKAGTLRPDHTGMRTIMVSCPVAAAKTISEGKRLLVGWVSAQVKLLEPRPLRCFRCHVGKHVGIHCTSEVDRSELCFRCGQPGHKAGSCSAAPHCVVCAAAGKPADHRAGSKACAAPAKAKAKAKPSATVTAAAASPAAAANVVAAAAEASPAAAANAVAAAAAATEAAAAGPSQGVREGVEMDCQ